MWKIEFEPNIRGYKDLFKEVTSSSIDELGYKECMAQISKVLFDNTDCGIYFHSVSEDGPIILAGRCLGVAGHCSPHELSYPFSSDDFWRIVNDADNDGVELWNDTHGEGEIRK